MKLIALTLLTVGLLIAQKPIPIIVDTDIGDDIDDALALALALQSPELDIRLITTVVDDVESRTRLVWKQLGLYGRQDIPIATGAPQPLLDPIINRRMPQFDVLTAADQPPAAAKRNAVDQIILTLLNSKEKITLVPIGPLTNIALALRTEPRIKDHIEKIVLMGGAYYPARREYNIYRDRIAAEIVFSSGLPIVGVGLDVTEPCKLEGADLERLRTANNPASQFLYKLIQLWQVGKADHYPVLYDPLAIASTIRPSLITTETGKVQVETASPMLYGTTVFTKGKGTVEAAKEVKKREFLDLFIERLAAPPRKH